MRSHMPVTVYTVHTLHQQTMRMLALECSLNMHQQVLQYAQQQLQVVPVKGMAFTALFHGGRCHGMCANRAGRLRIWLTLSNTLLVSAPITCCSGYSPEAMLCKIVFCY